MYKLTPQTLAIISYAKKIKKLKFSPQAVEIDHSRDEEFNITYDREGFYAEDITGFWNPDSFSDYLKANWTNFKEAYREFGFLKAFDFLSLKTPWSGWAWVLNSTTTIKNDIVDQSIKKLNHKDWKDRMNNYDKLLKEVTDEQIKEYLNANYLKVTEYMWIQENDPSVIHYDPINKPYKLKDGWSKEQVGEILEEWLELMTKEKIPTEFIENARW